MSYNDKSLENREDSGFRPGAALNTATRILFALMAALMAVDIAGDLHEGTDFAHLGIEIVVMGLALAGSALLWRQWLRERARAMAQRRESARARAEADRWKRQAEAWREEARGALDGLGEEIDRQFERWGLTSAEREIALLLLKGLSHKETAHVRGTSERTIRQQALTVYRKSGLTGRADLAAFFLEDLLLPARRDSGL